MIAPSVQAIEELSLRIKLLDREIRTLAHTKYPETSWLEQIPGVGPITALYFVLKIGDPARFERVRDVGAFIGLCPRRDQSGENDPQLRISKRGDAYLRRLLVSSAQYILGPFAPPSALRQYGLALAAGATARAKKRAVVAVARKLAVLLLTVWKNKSPYQAFPQQRQKMRIHDLERLRCIA
jgi:transposase